MNHSGWWHMISVAAVVSLAACSAARAQPKMLDVPRVDGIAIDGAAADWADRGLKIENYIQEGKLLPPAEQYDVCARLGWDDRGLLVLVEASDQDWSEGEKGFWEQDSLGIFLAAPGQGYCEFSISPGMSDKHPELRMETNDNRHGPAIKRTEKAAIEVKRSRQPSRCVLEARIPWSNFDPAPALGGQIGMLLVASDASKEGRRSLRWYSAVPDWGQGQGLRLAEKGSPPVNRIVAAGRFEKLETAQVQVRAVGELAGAAVQIDVDGRTLAQGKLAAEGRRSSALLTFPAPPLGQGQTLEHVAVQVAGQPPAMLEMANIDAERTRGLMTAKLSFGPSASSPEPAPTTPERRRRGEAPLPQFEGEKFPAPAFEDPAQVEKLAGPYHIEAAYFDDQCKSVTVAAKPGLYVGVATVVTDSGLKFRRFRALIRTGGQEVQAPERQWWNDFKRRYYKLDKQFSRRLEGPSKVEGKPALVLRKGTAKEAELNEEALAAVDAMCKRWAAETKEPFSVLIARHGVIVLHAAYGQKKDGTPATVDDVFRVASITKLLAGELSMMAVDQGIIGLDDPVGKYLPAFAEHPGPVTVTLRHLYTHTTDIPYLGDSADFEESAPLYVPYALVGKRFEYNSVGPSLIRRSLETATHEQVSALYQRCLFGPLSCTRTTASDMNGDARTTAMDLAICGQMLLNHGAYGSLRFFSEESFQKMLPPPDVADKDMPSRRGIGVRWYNLEGMGRKFLGHNSATESILRVGLEHDMIIVNIRSEIGPQFPKYQREFYNAVAETIKP